MPLWNGIRCQCGQKKKKPLSQLLVVFWLLECVEPESQDREPKCSCVGCFRVSPKLLFGELEKQPGKPVKSSSSSKQGTSTEEWGRKETVLRCVLSSETNRGSSSFCVVDWKRHGITYWWALVVQGETHASFKDIGSYCFQSASSDTQ